MKKTEVEKNEIKKIKNVCKQINNTNLIHQWLDYFYERITNKEITPEQALKYNLVDIINHSKKIYDFEYNKNDKSIIFEFLRFYRAPQNFLLVYNEFRNSFQTHIDMYVLKE